jgi:hypothetical protein
MGAPSDAPVPRVAIANGNVALRESLIENEITLHCNKIHKGGKMIEPSGERDITRGSDCQLRFRLPGGNYPLK